MASCTNPFYVNSIKRAQNWQPQIELPNSVVVCRQKQCAPAKLSMSREYIYNSLLHLLDNNSQNKALVCRADAASHICTENYLTIPVTVGVTPANMYIDDVKITDVSASIGSKSLNVILNYNVTYNGQTPVCKPAKSLVYVKNANNIVMEDAGYICKMTTIGNTTIKTLFAIDYIDLDYGYIGGYYSIGLSGPAFGGDSGYMMLRLPQDAYPLSPDLILKEEPKSEANESNPKTVQNSNQAIEQTTANANAVQPTVQPVAPVTNPTQIPYVVNAQGNSVPLLVDANGMPVPLIINQYGQPVPATYDENGKPIPMVLESSVATVPVAMQTSDSAQVVNEAQQKSATENKNAKDTKTDETKVAKEKVKPKRSSDIETKVTTSVIPMDGVTKTLPAKKEKVKSDDTYNGVEVFPLPLKKKSTKN